MENETRQNVTTKDRLETIKKYVSGHSLYTAGFYGAILLGSQLRGDEYLSKIATDPELLICSSIFGLCGLAATAHSEYWKGIS